jgi:hypothetical protein
VVIDEVPTHLQTKVHVSVNNKFSLDWWRINSTFLTRLSSKTKETLASPAFRAAGERSFSATGVTISQRRTALDTDTVENMFVHSNA